ncbi:MAG TPA: pilus assembly protein TadG-related protein [Candidatus Binatia bacterium]|nr:pilus assembly protein TadG-related protein [Candidatus Binatia bacterium]
MGLATDRALKHIDRSEEEATARGRRGERGVATLIALGGALAILGMAALVIDVGYVVLTRTQLQNIADAGGISGSRELARVYDDLGPTGDYRKHTLTGSQKARVLANINEFAQQNDAAGKSISIDAGDVVFGTYDKSTGTITATDKGAEVVQVRARRDETANGAVSTLLASVLGVDTFQVSASAANAGVTAASAMPPGTGDVPIGISKAWFTARDSPCGTDSGIKFHPTNSTVGCAGWHVFTEPTASASKLRSVIDGLRTGTFTAPAVTANATYFNFTGGTVSSAYDEFEELYEAKKDASGNWRVNVPVYDYPDCKNPHGEIKIIGFARAKIYNVTKHSIDANVECDVVEFGTGDGTADYFGVAVGRPRTIQ